MLERFPCPVTAKLHAQLQCVSIESLVVCATSSGTPAAHRVWLTRSPRTSLQRKPEDACQTPRFMQWQQQPVENVRHVLHKIPDQGIYDLFSPHDMVRVVRHSYADGGGVPYTNRHLRKCRSNVIVSPPDESGFWTRWAARSCGGSWRYITMGREPCPMRRRSAKSRSQHNPRGVTSERPNFVQPTGSTSLILFP